MPLGPVPGPPVCRAGRTSTPPTPRRPPPSTAPSSGDAGPPGRTARASRSWRGTPPRGWRPPTTRAVDPARRRRRPRRGAGPGAGRGRARRAGAVGRRGHPGRGRRRPHGRAGRAAAGRRRGLGERSRWPRLGGPALGRPGGVDGVLRGRPRWTWTPLFEDYGTVAAPDAPHPVGGIGPLWGSAPGWLVYVGVADVDAAVEAATAAGGSVVTPAHDSDYGGWRSSRTRTAPCWRSSPRPPRAAQPER